MKDEHVHKQKYYKIPQDHPQDMNPWLLQLQVSDNPKVGRNYNIINLLVPRKYCFYEIPEKEEFGI